jgi:hypothetical protein
MEPPGGEDWGGMIAGIDTAPAEEISLVKMNPGSTANGAAAGMICATTTAGSAVLAVQQFV